MEYRIEHDSLGEMKVPVDVYWGAQTQRSFENFKIGTEKMPVEIIRAFAILKKAAAIANCRLGKLDEQRKDLIGQVCDEILAGSLADNFPLVVWQTGSGTQSNMNVNEVVANRGNAIAGEKLLHPNDTVNMSQSSNDTYPTAIHIAAVTELEKQLFPSIDHAVEVLKGLEEMHTGVIKSGRTHLMDATPISFSQEISGWRAMLEEGKRLIESAMPHLSQLALGGTAVGTGINAPKEFGEEVAKAVSELTGRTFITEPNKFHALTGARVRHFTNRHGDYIIHQKTSKGDEQIETFAEKIFDCRVVSWSCRSRCGSRRRADSRRRLSRRIKQNCCREFETCHGMG